MVKQIRSLATVSVVRDAPSTLLSCAYFAVSAVVFYRPLRLAKMAGLTKKSSGLLVWHVPCALLPSDLKLNVRTTFAMTNAHEFQEALRSVRKKRTIFVIFLLAAAAAWLTSKDIDALERCAYWLTFPFLNAAGCEYEWRRLVCRRRLRWGGRIGDVDAFYEVGPAYEVIEQFMNDETTWDGCMRCVQGDAGSGKSCAALYAVQKYNELHRGGWLHWLCPLVCKPTAVYIRVEGSLIGDISRKLCLANDERTCEELARSLSPGSWTSSFVGLAKVTIVIDQVDDQTANWLATLDSCLRLSHVSRLQRAHVRFLLLIKGQEAATDFTTKNGGTMTVQGRLRAWREDELQKLIPDKSAPLQRNVTTPYEASKNRSTKNPVTRVRNGQRVLTLPRYVMQHHDNAQEQVASQLTALLHRPVEASAVARAAEDDMFELLCTKVKMPNMRELVLPFVTADRDYELVKHLAERGFAVHPSALADQGTDASGNRVVQVLCTKVKMPSGREEELQYVDGSAREMKSLWQELSKTSSTTIIPEALVDKGTDASGNRMVQVLCTKVAMPGTRELVLPFVTADRDYDLVKHLAERGFAVHPSALADQGTDASGNRVVHVHEKWKLPHLF